MTSPRPAGTGPGAKGPGAPELAVLKAIIVLIRILLVLPGRLLQLIFGRPPEVAAGLRPDAWAMARFTHVIRRDPFTQTPDEARAAIAALGPAVISTEWPAIEAEDTKLELEGRSLRARLYRPAGAPESCPLLVYFHGGGFVTGSLEGHDHALRILTDRSRVSVLSVEYRKAPEDPFPAGVDDALDAWETVVADPGRFGADPDRIGVGGDSAGGNLSAVLCQDLKRLEKPQPAFQFLLYPATIVGGVGTSYADFEEGFFLTQRGMDWFIEHYIGNGDPDQVRISPLLSEDLTGLAPAYVTTALADPLRDEGEAYAAKLHEAGVPVRLDRMPMIHGWFNFTGSRSTEAGMNVLAEVLAEGLGPAKS